MDTIFKTTTNILRKAFEHFAKASVKRDQTILEDIFPGGVL